MDKAEFDRHLDKLAKDIAKSHNYRVGDYKYFVYPYKGLLPLNSEQIENTVLLMSEIIPSNATMLFTVMTDGIILGLPLAMHLKKKFMVARDFHYNIPDVIKVSQKTGYYQREVFFTPVDPEERVAIVDVIISTGNTALASIKALQQCGCQIAGVFTVADKSAYGGSKKVRDLGIKCISLLETIIEDEKLKVLMPYNRNSGVY